jgi:cytochrome c oxidase subunit II
MDLLLAQTLPQTFWMPEQASTVAPTIDNVFYFIYWVCVVFFVIIAGVMFYFMIKYRRRGKNDKVGTITHHTGLEIAWSVLPSFLLVLMFWWGFKGFMQLRTVPPGAYDIRVDAAQWSFSFRYQNGTESDEVHTWKGKPTRMVMWSKDVLHAVFIPAFRVKRDIVPGRYSELWFEPTKSGNFKLYCAEYCGTSHSDMRARVIVHETKSDFDEWLKNADPLNSLTPEQFVEYKADYDAFMAKYKSDPLLGPKLAKLQKPVEMGAKLYEKKGCKSCHTIDGSKFTGPTWKALWGRQEAIAGGTMVTVDENYVRESIKEPNAKKVAGYENVVMPVTRLTDAEIDCLIEYMKTLK